MSKPQDDELLKKQKILEENTNLMFGASPTSTDYDENFSNDNNKNLSESNAEDFEETPKKNYDYDSGTDDSTKGILKLKKKGNKILK